MKNNVALIKKIKSYVKREGRLTKSQLYGLENYWAKHAERHTFYSYPAMMRSEALLIKQWDSAGLLATSNGEQSDRQGDGPCTFSFHSAFDECFRNRKYRISKIDFSYVL